MNLDKLTVEIRPRQAWQAVDLGILMARRWWWPLTKAWLLVSGPVWLLLCLLPPHLIFLQSLIVWWLKPLFERPLLHILSQAVFDAQPGTMETFKAFPRLAGIQIFNSLLWRRLSATRSMDLPVIQLEGLKGSKRTDRLRVLHREDSGPAPWITIFGMHMELFIVLAIYILVLMFWPQVLETNWNEYFIGQKSHWFNLLQNFFFFGAMTLVAPFYVASGFALYLNRRIRLEAWDLEIAFKNIVLKKSDMIKSDLKKHGQRVSGQKNQSTVRSSTLALVLLCVVLFSAAPRESVAGDTATSPEAAEQYPLVLNRDSSRKIIEEIKADEVFHQMKTVRVPDLSWLEFNEDEDEQTEGDLEFLKALFGFIARFGEVILWILVIFLVVMVAYRYRHWLAEVVFDQPIRSKRVTPKTLFGLDLTGESLPDDISGSARELWNQNRHRDCLSLLYRATLFRLIEKGLDIHDGDTEQECLESTKRHRKQLAISQQCIEYLATLTQLWRQLAYGHILPDQNDVIELCSAWNNIWMPERNG